MTDDAERPDPDSAPGGADDPDPYLSTADAAYWLGVAGADPTPATEGLPMLALLAALRARRKPIPAPCVKSGKHTIRTLDYRPYDPERLIRR